MPVRTVSPEQQHNPRSLKQISFINSQNNELFRIPDGGIIRLFYGNGDTMYAICRYLDDYHTEINGQSLHICDFAKRMERNGIFYIPMK